MEKCEMNKKSEFFTFDGRPFDPNKKHKVVKFDPKKFRRAIENRNVVEAAKEKAEEIVKEEEKRKKEESGGDMKSWLPWATAGGAGLIGHSLVSSLFDGDPDSDRKNKSIWYRLLATLAPIAAGGASAYGGYLLGKHLNGEKTAQANPQAPVRNVATSQKVTQEEPEEVFDEKDLKQQMEDHEGHPTRLWTMGGLSLGTMAGGAGVAYNQFKNWLNADPKVPQDPAVRESASRNIESYQQRIQAAEAELKRRAAANPDLAAVARSGAKDAVTAARNSKSVKTRTAAVDNARKLDEISKANVTGGTIDNIADLRRKIQEESQRMEMIRNPKKRMYGRRALAGTGIGLSGLLGALGFGSAIKDYYDDKSAIEDANNEVKLQRALMGARK